MNTTPKQNNEDQELDLSQLSRRMGMAYEGFLSWIFRGFLFIKNNLIILVLLIVVGVGIGYYLDKSSPVYDHQVIITPNFRSTEYVYLKIDLINAKIKERDSVFLKDIGISKPSRFIKIAIEPITDVYNFINNNEQNFDLIKLMAEDGDINKIIEDPTTSMNYSDHVLKITTKGKIGDEALRPVLEYLNNSAYYSKLQQSTIESIHKKIASNERTIRQIDSLLSDFSSASRQLGNNDRMIYYNNENTQLNDILQTKSKLTEELANKRVELINSDKIIKDVSLISNIRNNKGIGRKMKIIVPVLFVGMFLFFVLIRRFYRTQTAKINENLVL